MLAYKHLVKEVLEKGELIPGRNGNMLNLFGAQLKLLPADYAFPILTSRKMHYEGVFGEFAAFLQGPTHITDFRKQGCNYWNDWADKNGDIRVDYGNAWRDFNGVNQLEQIVDELKKGGFSRRLVLTGWNPPNIAELSLPCCHYAYQFMPTRNGRLDMIWVQRSADVMIGLPSDMIAAALFNILMARTVGLAPGELTLQLGSTHIYEQHLPLVQEYLDRPIHIAPDWAIDPAATIFNFDPNMITLFNYGHEPAMQFKLVV